MKHWLTLLTLLPLAYTLAAAEQCLLQPSSKNPQYVGPWIDQDNWLAPGNLRIGLQSANAFMPVLKIRSLATPKVLRPAPQQLNLARITVIDPLDRQQRNLEFLLDTRLYADGLVVLRNGKLLREQYWHGLSAQQPRLLLGATRPLLSLMGAMAVAQGKLLPDKSVMRYVSALSGQAGLRKLSIQRLLEARSRFDWSAPEIDAWQVAAGWKSGTQTGGVRAWLNQPERWERDFSDEAFKVADIGPDGDLLAWALAEGYRAPLAKIFCDNLLSKLRPENPLLWLTDAEGNELAGGLALSLRDFARFGQVLVEARNSGNHSKIPYWLIETLTASSGMRKTNVPELAGLQKGSEPRYGFIHLGGAANRIAILGPYGNSLYVDFDRQLVIALFAAYPQKHSVALQAMLEQVWETLGTAMPASQQR